jgi:hypothetical protein
MSQSNGIEFATTPLLSTGVRLLCVLPKEGRDSSAPPCCTTRAAYSCLRAVYVRKGTKHIRASRKR